MNLTPAQIAQVSAALPGWTPGEWEYGDCWVSPDDEVVLNDESDAKPTIRVEAVCGRAAVEKLKALIDQAAAAAKLLEQFHQEGKT